MPLDIEGFRKAGYQAIDRICDFYYNLEDRSAASKVEPGYLRKALPGQAPEYGEDFQVIADDYQQLIQPGLTVWQHPSFFAYFPTSSTFEGTLGDLYASAIPNPGFNWDCSPACTELEAIVMDWAAKLFGLDPVFYNEGGIGGGVFQTTASDAALVAVVAARSSYVKNNPGVDPTKLVIYTTTQTHSLGKKAALILGLRDRALPVTGEDQFSLRGPILSEALQSDCEQGLHPFILIATIGTTSSGAVDSLPEICSIVREYPGLWLHIDAAWAGVTLACPEYRRVCHLEEINRHADSFCTNFHKWGLVNFDCSTLWVRNRKRLTDALDITPEFLRNRHSEEGTVIDYRNWHLSLGRRFRALKVWFVLRSFGVEGFQKHLRKAIHLNEYFASRIRGSEILKLVTEPSFALSVFSVDAPAGTLDRLSTENDLTLKLYEKIDAMKDMVLTKTKLNDVLAIRFAVGAMATEQTHVDRAFKLLISEAGKIMKQGTSG